MMRRKLFSIGPTEVYLHLATLLLIFYMLLLKQGKILAISMLSILVHEAAHSLVAACLGKPPQQIEITPLGGMMRLEDEAELSTGKRLLVLLAGPAASLALCWLALHLTASGLLSVNTGKRVFATNLLFMAGNMLPALPMDGGRAVSLLLSLRLRNETVRKIMRAAGMILGLGFILLNLLLSLTYGGWNLSLSMVGCFLMYAAAHCTTTSALAELQAFMDRKIRLECKGTLRCKWVAVTNRFPLRSAIKQLSPDCYTVYACVDPAGIVPTRMVGEEMLISAYLTEPGGDICSVQRVEA